MQFKTRQKNGVTIADVSGKLTAGKGVVVLRSQVRGLLEAGARNIVLNLAGIQMMDSSGLGELVAAKRAAQAVGGGIRLLNVGSGVRRVFEAARLTGEFEFYDDESSAVASF